MKNNGLEYSSGLFTAYFDNNLHFWSTVNVNQPCMSEEGDYYLISCIFIFFISSHNIKITTLINREKEQQNECVK